MLLHRTFKGGKLNYKVFAMEEFQTSYGFLTSLPTIFGYIYIFFFFNKANVYWKSQFTVLHYKDNVYKYDRWRS